MGRTRKKNQKHANLRLPHTKDTIVNVGFNDADTRALDRLVEIKLPERIATEPKFGRATLIREYAMNGIREELAQLEPAAVGS